MGLQHWLGLTILLFPHSVPFHSRSLLLLLYFLSFSFTFQKLRFLTRGIAFTKLCGQKSCSTASPGTDSRAGPIILVVLSPDVARKLSSEGKREREKERVVIVIAILIVIDIARHSYGVKL